VPRALLGALLLSLAVIVAAADAALSVEVPAGKAKNIRLRNLPAGATMAVRITTTGRVLVALVAERDLRAPQPGSLPLFRGVVERRLAFRVSIAESGNYFLVLSNRGGAQPLEVQVEMRAVARSNPKPVPRRDERAGLFRPAGKGEQVAQVVIDA
jgi:hypothetical protein